MTEKKIEVAEAQAVEIDEVELDKAAGGVRKAGGGRQEYLEVKLENVMITSYQTGNL